MRSTNTLVESSCKVPSKFSIIKQILYTLVKYKNHIQKFASIFSLSFSLSEKRKQTVMYQETWFIPLRLEFQFSRTSILRKKRKKEKREEVNDMYEISWR